MTKFSGTQVRPQVRNAVITDSRALTHEGGQGAAYDARSALFLLGCQNMVREDTFYEDATTRDDRFRALVREVTAADPAWMRGFIPYLRRTMQMRSAAVVAAAEYAAAGGEGARSVIRATLDRADEPAELLAYWFQTNGRRLPQAVKRGVADAVRRLYTEKAALKYDGLSRAWRMGDVIELVHPKPSSEAQSALFKHLLDQRHHGDGALTLEGQTWERANPSTAAEWEALIPTMGYMALLRNLRNFDERGISDEAAAQVAARLANPDEVARSRQFPIRFYSAYKAVNTLRWAQPLEQAVNHSLAQVPSLPGRTLVLIDVSGSMFGRMSGRSEVQRWEIAALFGFALALRAASADVYAFSYAVARADVADARTFSVLRAVEQTRSLVGGTTQTWRSVEQTFAGHDRIVILTDEQAHDSQPRNYGVPIYTFNLAGYRVSHYLSSGQDGRYTFGGLTDNAFRLLSILESCKMGQWPWEQDAPSKDALGLS